MAPRPRCSSSGKENSGRFLAMEDLLRHLLICLRAIQVRVKLDYRRGVSRRFQEADRLTNGGVEEPDVLFGRELGQIVVDLTAVVGVGGEFVSQYAQDP